MDIIVDFNSLVLTSFFFYLFGVMTVVVFTYIKNRNSDKGVIDFIKFLINKMKCDKESDKK